MNIRILIADDHGIIRDGLRSMLEKELDFKVVGEASDGRSAVQLARWLRPKIVIMDIGMRELNGVEATRRLSACLPSTRVITLSVHSDRRFVTEALRAGTRGYVLKHAAFEKLAYAIRAVAAGEVYLSPAIGNAMQDNLCQPPDQDPQCCDHLSDRERELVQLLGQGKTVKEIAARLQVSASTVHTHRRRLMLKLHVRSDVDLIKHAIRLGWTSLDD